MPFDHKHFSANDILAQMNDSFLLDSENYFHTQTCCQSEVNVYAWYISLETGLENLNLMFQHIVLLSIQKQLERGDDEMGT